MEEGWDEMEEKNGSSSVEKKEEEEEEDGLRIDAEKSESPPVAFWVSLVRSEKDW